MLEMFSTTIGEMIQTPAEKGVLALIYHCLHSHTWRPSMAPGRTWKREPLQCLEKSYSWEERMVSQHFGKNLMAVCGSSGPLLSEDLAGEMDSQTFRVNSKILGMGGRKLAEPREAVTMTGSSPAPPHLWPQAHGSTGADGRNTATFL